MRTFKFDLDFSNSEGHVLCFSTVSSKTSWFTEVRTLNCANLNSSQKPDMLCSRPLVAESPVKANQNEINQIKAIRRTLDPGNTGSQVILGNLDLGNTGSQLIPRP